MNPDILSKLIHSLNKHKLVQLTVTNEQILISCIFMKMKVLPSGKSLSSITEQLIKS